MLLIYTDSINIVILQKKINAYLLFLHIGNLVLHMHADPHTHTQGKKVLESLCAPLADKPPQKQQGGRGG